MRYRHYFFLLYVAVASSCAASQADRLTRKFVEAQQGYLQTVAKRAVELAPGEAEGIELMLSFVVSMHESKACEIRFLLVREPHRVRTGTEEDPWVTCELNDSESQQLSESPTMKRYVALSSEWRNYQKRLDIQRIWRKAAKMPSSKDAWKARKKELIPVINGIQKIKAANGEQEDAGNGIRRP